jgi:predicted ribosome quality control (RQC) complex YloA/Tae2 family protein
VRGSYLEEKEWSPVFDVLTIAAVTDELSDRVVDGRIQKVIQLDDLSYGLEVFNHGKRRMLVARASSQTPGLYLSDTRLTADPDQVSPLLLLLRKYARGGFIVGVEQPPLERIVRVSIAKRFFPDNRADDDEDLDNEAAELVYTHIVVELMGRHSNVILLDDDERVMDSAKRVTQEMSRVRPILPHRQYENPPPQTKQDPRTLDALAAQDILAQAEGKTPVTQHLVRSINGFSPQMTHEAVFRAFGTVDLKVRDLTDVDDVGEKLTQGVRAIVAAMDEGHWEPSVYVDDGAVRAFAPIQLQYMSEYEREQYDTISAAIERALEAGGVQKPVRHAQRRETLVAEIQNAVERSEARVRSLTEQLDRAEEGDELRQKGELIYAYLWKINPGDPELDADGTIVRLDPDLSASDNAQRYFERYHRLKQASDNLPKLLKRAQAELDYVRQLRTQADQADGIEQIEQLRREFQSHENARSADASDGKKKGSRQPKPKNPDSYRTERSDIIYVGRSGPQNERVVFDMAGPNDTWLHARGLPGSHVVIHWAGQPDDEIVEKAASLAAWYSSGRASTTVEVDATDCRYVRKIRGAGPGMVTYRNERTLNVRPQGPEELGFNGA